MDVVSVEADSNVIWWQHRLLRQWNTISRMRQEPHVVDRVANFNLKPPGSKIHWIWTDVIRIRVLKSFGSYAGILFQLISIIEAGTNIYDSSRSKCHYSCQNVIPKRFMGRNELQLIRVASVDQSSMTQYVFGSTTNVHGYKPSP